MTESDRSALIRLIGCWQGRLAHRAAADEPWRQLPATADNRWALGGRFIEMTLRAGTSVNAWSIVLYFGYERSQRRHVLVSLEPDDRCVTTQFGDWTLETNRLLLTSHQSCAICDMTVPGRLTLQIAERPARGEAFVRFSADYRNTIAPTAVKPVAPREHRRFVIA